VQTGPNVARSGEDHAAPLVGDQAAYIDEADSSHKETCPETVAPQRRPRPSPSGTCGPWRRARRSASSERALAEGVRAGFRGVRIQPEGCPHCR